MPPDFSHINLLMAQVDETARLHEEALRTQALAEQAAASMARQAWMEEQVRRVAREQAIAHTAALLDAKEDAARQLERQMLTMDAQFEEAERFARQLADATHFHEIDAYLASIEDSQRFVEQMDQVRRDMTLYLRSFESNLDVLTKLGGLPYGAHVPDYTGSVPPDRASPRVPEGREDKRRGGIPLPWGKTLSWSQILLFALGQVFSPFSGLITIDRSTTNTYVQPQILVACEDIRALKEPKEDAETIEELPSGTKIITFEGSDEWCPVWPVGKLEAGWVLPKSLMEPEC